ncbi:MAG TPA: L-glutamate gamma-semialdehyde dehydrogenase [Cytophagaceae bacterium]|jgi:1-pyrroline-5-carboxylate dehydrogenase|nr:L-glutamate gamma-semialdehyde dehydrogenase [Cytophagaceae bacterium]
MNSKKTNPVAIINEPILNYESGSGERNELKKAIRAGRSGVIEIPMYIGTEKIVSGKKTRIAPPYDHKNTIAHFYEGDETHVRKAIEEALKIKKYWSENSTEHRAEIFLKAADLVSGKYRAKINAATMLGQSKNVFQAEIDSACELADFLRFNVKFMYEIYAVQPYSPEGINNMMEYRPLEGFVFALTPFNFTAIAGNLPCAPALMGNTVVWKPAFSQIYSANVIMEILLEAGLPPGVINLIYVDGPVAGEVILHHRDFAGIHFTGSTKVFTEIWRTIGNNLSNYKSFPRIVGETGGKNFMLAHASADTKALSTALLRGAFEYQGQKCSATSRAYIPESIWPELKKYLLDDLKTVKMGSPENFTNFINAVIDERAFDRITKYIHEAKKAKEIELIAGGNYDKSVGYFIEPTIFLSSDPHYVTMCEEIFGPVLTIYIYEDEKFEDIIKLADATSSYGLTGAIFASDKRAIELLTSELKNAAGNFYINDKSTGAVVNQQPFGGARRSGTNDKAGSMLNLLRWVSPRVIKENFNPPTDYRYPFMKKE